MKTIRLSPLSAAAAVPRGNRAEPGQILDARRSGGRSVAKQRPIVRTFSVSNVTNSQLIPHRRVASMKMELNGKNSTECCQRQEPEFCRSSSKAAPAS